MNAVRTALLILFLTLGMFGTAGLRSANSSPSGIVVDSSGSDPLSVTITDPAGVAQVQFWEKTVASKQYDGIKAYSCSPIQTSVSYTSSQSTRLAGSSLFLVEKDCAGRKMVQEFDSSGGAIPGRPAITLPANQQGPGARSILIHEFDDVSQESAAFGSGSLDLMDWPAPLPFVENWTAPGGIVGSGRAGLFEVTSFGTWLLDINSYNSGTNTLAMRQALAYLVDRQQIVNVFAGGLATPICALFGGQGFSGNCLRLGYPTAFGDFDPTKALQTLYEAGYRDCGDGSLGLPGSPGNDCSFNNATSGPTLAFYVRLDDVVRRQLGDLLTTTLTNLPNSFGTTTVCATAHCRINVNEVVAPRSAITSVVFRATGVRSWNLYTGGWSSAASFPESLDLLYGSANAWSTCGGRWTPNVGASNYDCYVDVNWDPISAQVILPEPEQALSKAAWVLRYGWGYSGGRINGTIPSVPLYSLTLEEAFLRTDVGSADGLPPNSCWKGLTFPFAAAYPVLTTTASNMYVYNCQEQDPSYGSYRGQAILDLGLMSHVDSLNIVYGDLISDRFVLQLAYDSCLTQSPLSFFETIVSMCESYNQTTAFNTALGKLTTVSVFKFQDGLRWSDGAYATALDFKFSVEYVQAVYGAQSYLVDPVYRVDVSGADPANGIGGTAIVYFNDEAYYFAQNAGLLPIVAQHVWCPSWPDTVTDCPYANPLDFPDFDFTKHVGTGPYVLSSCTGEQCSSTITLTPNPYYDRSASFYSEAEGIRLQPDLNRDDHVNEEDVQLIQQLVDYRVTQAPFLDIDGRTGSTHQTFSVSSMVGPGSVTVNGLKCHCPDTTDQYIVSRLLFEGGRGGLSNGLTWPPNHKMTYDWPDSTKDNYVNLDDLISVYLHQFQDPHNISTVDNSGRSISLNDVDYSGDISLSDLVITFTRQFTKPVYVP